MEKVYIISRYSAKTWHERRFNKEVTKYYCRRIAEAGKRPVAPHLFYTQFMDDDDPKARRLGRDFAIKDLDECDRFLLVIVDGVISSGMRGEIEHVTRTGKRGRLMAISKAQAKKLIEGRETDGTARDQHRPGGRL
mgnify:CR=1 FL=1